MHWDEELNGRLDDALNESTACGISFEIGRDEVCLLLEVEALPEAGPIDPDPRRVLVMTGIADVSIIVRPDEEPLGPALPMGSLDEVEELFVRADWIHPMYGWEFFDTREPREAWLDAPSLVIAGRNLQSDHVLRWFAECGVRRGDDADRYAVQGIVRFDELRVQRADGTEIPVSQFADEGARWWRAFYAKDPRLSVEGQRAANAAALHWRPQQGGQSTIVPAGSWDEA